MPNSRLFLSLLVLFAIPFAGAVPKAAKKADDHTLKGTLEAISQVQNHGALLMLVGKASLIEDVRLMKNEFKELKQKPLKPIEIKKISDKAILVSGLQGPLVFEKNGDEVVYRETLIKLDRQQSFEQHYELLRKKLAKWHAGIWWISRAFAEERDVGAREEAFKMAQLIDLIYAYQSGKITYEDMNAQKGNILGMGAEVQLNFKGYSIVNGVSCSPDKDGPNPDEVGEITFNLDNGGKYTIKRVFDTRGKPSYFSFLDTKGKQQLIPNKDSSVAKLFESMADKKHGGFCTTPLGNKDAMVNGARLIQEGLFEMTPVEGQGGSGGTVSTGQE